MERLRARQEFPRKRPILAHDENSLSSDGLPSLYCATANTIEKFGKTDARRLGSLG
jgi:hypothetical protein